MDEFEKWIEANYQSMPTNRRELSEFAFKAGREAGLREAAEICDAERNECSQHFARHMRNGDSISAHILLDCKATAEGLSKAILASIGKN